MFYLGFFFSSLHFFSKCVCSTLHELCVCVCVIGGECEETEIKTFSMTNWSVKKIKSHFHCHSWLWLRFELFMCVRYCLWKKVSQTIHQTDSVCNKWKIKIWRKKNTTATLYAGYKKKTKKVCCIYVHKWTALVIGFQRNRLWTTKQWLAQIALHSDLLNDISLSTISFLLHYRNEIYTPLLLWLSEYKLVIVSLSNNGETDGALGKQATIVIEIVIIIEKIKLG